MFQQRLLRIWQVGHYHWSDRGRSVDEDICGEYRANVLALAKRRLVPVKEQTGRRQMVAAISDEGDIYSQRVPWPNRGTPVQGLL